MILAGGAAVAAWLLGINVWLAALWWADKRAGRRGTQRIRERSLLWLSALGGWPAALLMMRLLRHKTRKQPFVSLFVLSALLNCSALVLWWWRG